LKFEIQGLRYFTGGETTNVLVSSKNISKKQFKMMIYISNVKSVIREILRSKMGLLREIIK
jgi:hypothetical protein